MTLAAVIIGGIHNQADAANKKDVTIGSRAAVNALLGGRIPWRWQMRAGGAVSPKTLLWPVNGRGIGRGFGSRNGTHLAIDITAPTGTPVRAVARGIVGYADDEVRGYGKLMLVLHPGGDVSLYAHLSAFRARPGQIIRRGQVIALVGNTGISRGSHLHFALFEDGKPIDPEPLFQHIPRHHRRTDVARRE